MKIHDDFISGMEEFDLMNDPRKNITDLGSNRANVKSLREFKQLYPDVLEIHNKLIHSDVLSHIEGITVNELKSVLRRYHIDYFTIEKVASFLAEDSRFVECILDSDHVYRLYLKPKCNYVIKGAVEWISQNRYIDMLV
jgi:hypothetical protein